MEKIKSGYIIKSAGRVRNKDRIPVHDLRKRVLLRNFLRHQIGIQPHSLFDLREKKKDNKKDAAAVVVVGDKKRRVALKSLPSSVVQGTSSSNSVLNDVQVNRVSSSLDTDLQCSVVSSSSVSSGIETDQVRSSIVPLQSEPNDPSLVPTPTPNRDDHPCVSLIEDEGEEARARAARLEKIKKYNGQWMWRRKFGLSFIRRKFRSFMKVCAKKQALHAAKKPRKIFLRPIKLKVVPKEDSVVHRAVADSTADKRSEVPKIELSISATLAISENHSEVEIEEQESLHKESKMLTKELDYYITLYESKPRHVNATALQLDNLSVSKKSQRAAENDENSSPCSRTVGEENASTNSSKNSTNVVRKIIRNMKSKVKPDVKKGKLTIWRSTIVKAFQKEDRKWYERSQYLRLKEYYIPACGNDHFTVEQHIKHKCLPSHVSFLPYTKYMKASEYFLYLHSGDGIPTTCMDHHQDSEDS